MLQRHLIAQYTFLRLKKETVEEVILIEGGNYPLPTNEEIKPENMILLRRNFKNSCVFFHSLKKNQGMICLLHELS